MGRWRKAIFERLLRPRVRAEEEEIGRHVRELEKEVESHRGTLERLAAKERDLQVVTDTMPAAVCRTGNDLRFVWMNPLYCAWIGRAAADALGKPVAEVLGEEQMRAIEPHVARVLKGEQVQYERLAELPGLGRRWISALFAPILDASGKVDGWVSITTDIHDRKMAEHALRAADRRKDDFLATLAHELRNPLAPIRNAVAILDRKSALDSEVAWSHGVIARQVEQLSRLIEDLLDIERISHGKFLVRKERIALERAIDMALEMSRPWIHAAGHRLSVLMPPGELLLEADPARLAQVFSNLLNNAAKFTEPQGEIRLAVATQGDSVIVTVEDNGIGFAPEVASRLFNAYTQLSAGPQRTRAGLGIGLSLVRGIVALHGGSVKAESDGEGRGARFTVRLPLAAVDRPGGRAGLAKSGETDDRRDAAVVRRSPASGLRVLVADDNRDAADSLKRILALYGFEAQVAYDGESALALAERFAPQLAILDIGMPGANGYEVARGMRSRSAGGLKLIALTGWGQEGDRQRALDAGFDFHLTKPVDPEVLSELLLRVAAGEESARAAAQGGGALPKRA